ncbi:hypothetical protein CDO52_19725 [Nocardiopsis gilva YIM 90087]|uniref:Peptidase M48 domain-containing protein n=1 Tax=Nocardiopsis gilva YIM 90087 TaxID=1235441 RepID=A0A223S9F8_9ACTN|nr:hypothetical protein [Nocardiopsis gilva]ASU84733.1 hypothetical protein CDO52_19725 [Nocardiopsis gilva YIM 90087]
MYLGFWYVALGAVLGVDFTGATSLEACAAEARDGAGRVADQAVLNTFLTCTNRMEREIILWMVGIGPVWACLTAVIYAVYPVILRRKLHPVRIPADSGVRAARQEADVGADGTPTHVRLLTTPGTAGGARVFGAFGRYRLAVDTSLLAPRADGNGLDERSLAMIRHEVAHLRNRDVDITYLTMSS